MDDMIWQEHTYVLDKQPGVGFGVAIGGQFVAGENQVIISDVVPVGPAVNKFQFVFCFIVYIKACNKIY